MLPAIVSNQNAKLHRNMTLECCIFLCKIPCDSITSFKNFFRTTKIEFLVLYRELRTAKIKLLILYREFLFNNLNEKLNEN